MDERRPATTTHKMAAAADNMPIKARFSGDGVQVDNETA
jgi:hypothetical protein